MRIDITIERGKSFDKDSAEGKKLKAIFKRLIGTAFPVGILHSKPDESNDVLHFVGTVEDFIDAVNIKDKWVKGGRTIEGKKAKNAELKPICEKSQQECDHSETNHNI